MKTSYQVSERRACTALDLARSTIRHKSIADPQTALRMRLRDLAMARIGYGYRRLHILIEREGWHVNHKRVYRLYREEGLAMRKRPPRRRKACLKRDLRPLAAEKNECWSMDFMSDELFDGRRIRLLTIVDNHTRESLAIHVGQRVRGCEVVEVLERVAKDHGKPGRSGLIMARSSSRKTSISGLTGIMSLWISPVPGSRRITLISSPSTAGSGRSA